MIKPFSILLLLASTVSVAHAEGPLKSNMTAKHVSFDTNGKEVLAEKEDVAPGDVLEYALEYENTGENALNGVVVSAPVPNETEFVDDSAATLTKATFEVSVDEGLTWHSPPVYKTTVDGDVLVPAAEYDLVRWTPETAISSGETWKFKYRVKVK